MLHPNLLILSSPSLSVNYHFSIFELFPYDLHIHATRFREYPLSLFIFVIIIRGYYMAPWRYEISLRVMKNISQVSAAKKGKKEQYIGLGQRLIVFCVYVSVVVRQCCRPRLIKLAKIWKPLLLLLRLRVRQGRCCVDLL